MLVVRGSAGETTKVFAGLAAGVPITYAGVGQVATDLTGNPLGLAVGCSVKSIPAAMKRAVERQSLARSVTSSKLGDARTRWVKTNRSLTTTGRRAATFVLSSVRNKRIGAGFQGRKWVGPENGDKKSATAGSLMLV